MYSWFESTPNLINGDECTKRELQSTWVSRKNDNATARGLARSPTRAILIVSVGLALLTVGVACVAVTFGAHGADRSGQPSALHPCDLTGLPPRVQVQPRAWEFAPPMRNSDLSPDSARTVDQLYDQLMRSIPRCSQSGQRGSSVGQC